MGKGIRLTAEEVAFLVAYIDALSLSVTTNVEVSAHAYREPLPSVMTRLNRTARANGIRARLELADGEPTQ